MPVVFLRLSSHLAIPHCGGIQIHFEFQFPGVHEAEKTVSKIRFWGGRDVNITGQMFGIVLGTGFFG